MNRYRMWYDTLIGAGPFKFPAVARQVGVDVYSSDNPRCSHEATLLSLADQLNNPPEIQVQFLSDKLTLTQGSADAAGMDIHAAIDSDIYLAPGATHKFPTGFKVAIPQGWAMLILPRSGLACNTGVAPANSPGLIDPDYRGEVQVCLHCYKEQGIVIKPGNRIAQAIVIPFNNRYVFVDSLPSTERGEGGFGSTGE